MKRKGLNLQSVKALNTSAILNTIRRNQSISRADIARTTNLSPTTCTDITKSLMDEGIIVESGEGDSSGGRRPVLLKINADYGAFIGVELNFKEMVLRVYNMNLEEVYEAKREGLSSLDNSFAAIRQCVEDYKQSARPRLDIKGMTIGVTAIVDFPSNRLLGSQTLNSRAVIDLQEMLRKHFEFDVFVENDANILAYTEKSLYFNEAKSLVYFLIGNGIGAGIIFDDRIVHGKHGYAGEIGHMTMDPNGPLCFCGKKGCLEVLASQTAVKNKIHFGVQAGNETVLSRWCREPHCDLSMLVDAAEAGDRLATDILNEEAYILFLAIVNLVAMFDPDTIVLGGLPDRLADYVVNYTNQAGQATLFSYEFADRLVKSNIGNRDMLCYGAAWIGLEHFFMKAFVN